MYEYIALLLCSDETGTVNRDMAYHSKSLPYLRIL